MRLCHPFRWAVVLLAALAPAFASNLALLRTLNLQSEICDPQSQQFNSPLSGVDFVSEDEVLAYTVCRVGVALSLRDRFQPTDPNHLKGIVLDLASGAVKQHFDWPTHGHESFIRVTHRGDLLVRRDAQLNLLSAQGKPLAGARMAKSGRDNSMLFTMSPAVNAIAVAVTSSASNGQIMSGVAVLDSRNLQLLRQWPGQADLWAFAASPLAAAGVAGAGTLLGVRDLSANQWLMVARSRERSIFQPVFVSDSEFAVPAQNDVQLFNTSGENLGRISCPNALKVAVSRDGAVLAMMCLGNSLGRSLLPSYGPQFGSITIDVYRLAPRHLLGSLDQPAAAAFSYDFALSPSGSKLAVIHNLELTVFQIPSE
jgi:hypothetical protein